MEFDASFVSERSPWKPPKGGRRSEAFNKQDVYMPTAYYEDKETKAARRVAREKADMKRVTEKPFQPASRATSYKHGKGADLGVMNSIAQTSVMMHPRNLHNTSFPSESGIVRKSS